MLLLVVVLIVSTLSLASPALAGDEPAAIASDPETVEADPGEEFEITVLLESHGGWGPEAGLESVRLLVLTHPDALEIVDLEADDWLAGDETTLEGSVTIDEERGIGEVHQYRNPPNAGATGDGVFATVTLRVPNDITASNATVEFSESQVMLADGNPLPVYDRPLTVKIDGGGETVETSDYDHGDLSTFGGADKHAETGQGSDEPETPPNVETESSDESELSAYVLWPSVAIGLSLLALVGFSLRWWHRR